VHFEKHPEVYQFKYPLFHTVLESSSLVGYTGDTVPVNPMATKHKLQRLYAKILGIE